MIVWRASDWMRDWMRGCEPVQIALDRSCQRWATSDGQCIDGSVNNIVSSTSSIAHDEIAPRPAPISPPCHRPVRSPPCDDTRPMSTIQMHRSCNVSILLLHHTSSQRSRLHG